MKLAGVALLALAAGVAHAQTWPAKPVRVIVSTGPGLASDIVMRALAVRLTSSLSQSFVVENIGGAGGIIAAQAVARAAPDGYTYLFTGGGALVTNLFVFKSLPYDPAKELAPVAAVTRGGGFYISVPTDFPAKTVGELIALSKSQPGKLSYGVDTSNIYTVLLGRMLNRAAGTDMVEIPYKSAAVAMQDTAAGRIQVLITSGTTVDAAVKSGKLRRMAVSSAKRNPFFPELPSIAETLPGFQIDGAGLTLVAPAGVPPDILQRLNRAVVAVLRDGEFEKQLAARGQMAGGSETPEEIAAELREQRVLWAKLFRELGIEPQ